MQQAVPSRASNVDAPRKTCLRCGSSRYIRVVDGGIAEVRPFYWDAAEIVAACAA
jgi:hypothetical protein